MDNFFVLIALLTDFGTQDYYVGAMKGVIFSINKRAQIVDISHEIEPQNVRSAGFVLASCYRNFPAKTIFLTVVDPGVGSARRAILVAANDYYFIAPDNGLLSFVFENEKDFRVFQLTTREFFLAEVSRTFHGRDVFAPVAAHLSVDYNPLKFGAETADYVKLENLAPRATSENKTRANIIHIDRFGNLVTNLRRENLPEKFVIEIGAARINKICDFYAEAAENELITIFGSAGFLEISAVNASAAEILQVNRNTEILVKPI